MTTVQDHRQSHGSITALQSRLKGIGRRTTAPVTPLEAKRTILEVKPELHVDVTSESYTPPTMAGLVNGRMRAASSTSVAPSFHSFSPSESLGSSVGQTPTHRRANTNDMVSQSRIAQLDEDDELSVSVSSNRLSASQLTASPLRLLVKQGFLRKRSPAGLKLWQLRFCMLYNDCFVYAKKQGDRLQGNISLSTIRACRVAIDRYGRVKSEGARFEICVGEEANGRVFHLEAGSALEADEWVAVINRATRRLAAETDALSRPQAPTVLLAPAAATATEDRFWKSQLPASTSVAAPVNAPTVSTHSVSISQSASRRSRRAETVTLNVSHITLNESQNSLSPSTMAHFPHTPSPITPIIRASKPNGSPLSFPSHARNESGEEMSPMPQFSASSVLTAHTSASLGSSSRLSVYRDDRSSSVPLVSLDSAIEIVQSFDDHRTFIVREKINRDHFYTMHVTPRATMCDTCCLQAYEAASVVDHPFILNQVYRGETTDAVFALYTPAFRMSDSLWSQLQTHRRLPEAVVKHIAVHCVLSLSHLHRHGLHYPTLSPSSVSIDGEGRAVLSSPFAVCVGGNDDNHFSPVIDAEYTSPDFDEHMASDWWRLGIMLYELACGIPPIRSKCREHEERWRDIREQLECFHSLSLPFPPFVSSEFASFVRQLLMVDSSVRLGCGEEGLKEVCAHYWLSGVEWDKALECSASASPLWIQKHLLELDIGSSSGTHTPTVAWSGHHRRSPSSMLRHQRHRSEVVGSLSATPLGSPNYRVSKAFFAAAALVTTQPLVHVTNEAFLTQKRAPVRPKHSSTIKSSFSTLQMTVMGARHLPLPKEAKDSDDAATRKSKRRTLNKEEKLALMNKEFHAKPVQPLGVYCSVKCKSPSGEESQLCVSKLVIGQAAAQPSFGDEFQFSLSSDSLTSWSMLMVELRHTRVGFPLIDSSSNRALGTMVGSIIIPIKTLTLTSTASTSIWHSVIDEHGLVVGELHVNYAFTEAKDVERPTLFLSIANHSMLTFQRIFGMPLIVTSVSDCGNGAMSESGELNSVQEHLADRDNTDVERFIEPQEIALLNASGITSPLLLSEQHSEQIRLLLTVNRRTNPIGGVAEVDVSYITDRVIAMSRPIPPPYTSTNAHIINIVRSFRNTSESLSKYVDTYHSAKLRTYEIADELSELTNVCHAESMMQCVFPAYGVPSLSSLLIVCQDMRAWLRGDSDRVVAVHCPSGVWRSCWLIACFLLLDRTVTKSDKALALVSRQRTNSAAITFSPSQRRYVNYLEKLIERQKRVSSGLPTGVAPIINAPHRPLAITHVRISAPGSSVTALPASGWYALVFSSHENRQLLYDSRLSVNGMSEDHRESSILHQHTQSPVVDLSTASMNAPSSSDCEVVLANGHIRVSCCINTAFIGGDYYMKLRLDELDCDAAMKLQLPASMQIELQFATS